MAQEAKKEQDPKVVSVQDMEKAELLQKSKNKLADTGIPKAVIEGMAEQAIIETAKALLTVEQNLSTESTNTRMKAFRETAIDCKKIKEPLKILAESSLDYVNSEIGVNPTWSKGGSIKLSNNDRIMFSLKFINPNVNDKELKARQEVSKTFVNSLQKTVEGIGLKPLREYLNWKLQDRDNTKQGIFSEVLKVDKYNVQLELGYSKAEDKEE